MNAMQEINGIVKAAQAFPIRTSEVLKRINVGPKKAIDWFDERYQNAMNGTAKKFNFNEQAIKILKPFRQRVGQHEADQLARDFSRQLKEMQTNLGRYDENAQRAMLDQWKDRIAQFDRQQRQTNDVNRLYANRQTRIAPDRGKSLGTGWTGREVVQGGNAPVSRVDPSAVRPRMNAVANVDGMNYFSDGKGQSIAQSDLPSMKMQWWNKKDAKPPKEWAKYVASYSAPTPRRAAAPQVAANQVAKADLTRAFGEK